jgi:hypothetical protein
MSNSSEWNLIRKEFDALARNEGAQDDNLPQLFDHQIYHRFGKLIAREMGHPTDYGVRWRETAGR